MSQISPEWSRAFPVFREDKTFSNSLIFQGGDNILEADSRRTWNSWSWRDSKLWISGNIGLGLSLCLYSFWYIFFTSWPFIFTSPWIFLTPIGGEGFTFRKSFFFHFFLFVIVIDIFAQNAKYIVFVKKNIHVVKLDQFNRGCTWVALVLNHNKKYLYMPFLFIYLPSSTSSTYSFSNFACSLLNPTFLLSPCPHPDLIKKICCCVRKVVIWEYSFFSATKQDRVGPSLLSRRNIFTFCS